MRLQLAGTTVKLDATTIVSDVDIVVEPGEFVGLVGPNGSGKTTLLRTIYRALRPSSGTVSVGGDDVWSLHAREAARRTAVVVQETPSEIDFAVFEVVALGRVPHKGPLDRETREDRRICADALERVGMTELADRLFSTLSGGEKQRVLVARALAQESRLLVLDEPTNHLDIRFQLDLLELIRGLGVTTIASMHDLTLAADHCDRLYVLKDGRVVADGPPAQVLTAELVADVFGVAVRRWVDPASQRAFLAFDRLPAPQRSPALDPT
jgi:iron complex transport system ATP-binding protein